MYRVGLGECFLLTFPRLGTPFHMLIDCGMTPGLGSLATIKRVSRDIRVTTGGRLDVLVATHRHFDHLSGFRQARDEFERMLVEQVWLGWLEDPDDAAAARLRRKRDGGVRPQGSPNAQAMDVVHRLGKSVRYWRGGEGPVALPGVRGARVFFLGPPKEGANLSAARRAAGQARIGESPFDPRDRVSSEEARTDPRFETYFGARNATENETAWRQIGQKPSVPTPPLRLDQAQFINDSSLAMAIELASPDGDNRVLLFPGDAQVASWVSWHGHRWPPEAPDATTCATLLARTVLYKVSHKGSATGTPIQFGLDMMTHPDLVALISVDATEAKKKMWQMPAATTMAALMRRTRGRVIRSDTGPVDAPKGERGLSDAEREQFQRSVAVSGLYVDYHLTVPQLSAGAREKSEANWAAANERRVYLIDKKLAGTIRPEEEAELREIERLLDEYLSITAPMGSGLITDLRETVTRAKRSGESM